MQRTQPPVEADENEHDDGPLREDCGQTVYSDLPPRVQLQSDLIHNPPRDQTHCFDGSDEAAGKYNVTLEDH